MSKFKPGDRVCVTDPALAKLRELMASYGHHPKPNHHGTVEEVWSNGSILIHFDDGTGAPYPEAEVQHLQYPQSDAVE